MLGEWVQLGIDVEPSQVEQLNRAIVAMEAAGVEGMPPEQQLFSALGLSNFYARGYRLASDHAHFSLASAIEAYAEDIQVGVLDERKVALHNPLPGLSAEALEMTTLTYGLFLGRLQPLIENDVAPFVIERLAEYLDEWSGR